MRIIISPAKQMRVDTDSFVCTELPVFTDRAEVLKDWIRSLSYEEQKTLWACNDKIARQNAERFAHMDLTKNLTPALLAYDGIQYTYMAPAVFEDGQFDYVQEHLRILSGFYGVVKPLDGAVPYRLEMQAKAEFRVPGTSCASCDPNKFFDRGRLRKRLGGDPRPCLRGSGFRNNIVLSSKTVRMSTESDTTELTLFALRDIIRIGIYIYN